VLEVKVQILLLLLHFLLLLIFILYPMFRIHSHP
jgi:hypothetical protein